MDNKRIWIKLEDIQYDDDCYVDDFIIILSNYKKQYPTNRLKLDFGYYTGSPTNYVSINLERFETDEECILRQTNTKKREEIRRQNDLMELERLRKKYGHV